MRWVQVNGDWYNLNFAVRIRRGDNGKLVIEYPPLHGQHITITIDDEATAAYIEQAIAWTEYHTFEKVVSDGFTE